LQVQPLSAEAVTKLAAGRGIDPDDLYRKTNGNPFFVTEVLRGESMRLPTPSGTR
jgi:hypothetical protein